MYVGMGGIYVGHLWNNRNLISKKLKQIFPFYSRTICNLKSSLGSPFTLHMKT
jgi:hypothetical protein